MEVGLGPGNIVLCHGFMCNYHMQ